MNILMKVKLDRKKRIIFFNEICSSYIIFNLVSDFDVLYSTRFFGPMVFYLCWFKKLDNFIAHLIETSNINDCVRVITLYSLINEQKINENSTNPLDLIKV